MRQVTATEKYRAVNEGKMAKKEFVRQMRQSFPQFVSQYNGFDDTVQILKNRGMLFEEIKPAFSEAKVYDDRPALTYSLDALDRGIRAELAVLGIDAADAFNIKADDYLKAEKKAKDNLEKDANHYLNLMAGESSKVDKHDKEKEVKRGAGDKDTFNDMKKATLKEEVEVVNPNPPMSEDAKKALLGKVVGALRTNYPDITAGIVKDFIKTHYQDLLDGADIEDEFREYISVNYESLSDLRENKEMDDVYGDGDVVVDITGMSPGMKAVWEIEKEISEFGDSNDAQLVVDNMIEINSEEHLINYLENRDIDTQTIVHMVKAYNSASISEKKGKDYDKDGEVESPEDEYKGSKDRAIKTAMGKQDQLKEAIKTIIKKTLTEEVVNEAATKRLADWGEGYESFEGVKSVVNDLENVVTEVEAFYDKVGDKIAKIFERTAEFKNEEGLKIGAFIAPSLEAAFFQDMRPVTKKGFLNKIDLPKVKTISQADVQTARERGEIDETPVDPKETIFTPNF